MTRRHVRLSRRGVFAASLILCAALALRATETVPATPAAIQQELKSFATLGSVLHVAAHPDDENRPLLAYLSLGRGYRTAYLSITRGDGGQNEIGPEFGEKLGVARTQELLAGRRIDGARQYFTRALDFGFSKDVTATLAIWDHQQVLADVVRVIRTFRPDVIITAFSPVPSNTHGHHTASAVLALEAFKLSGDPQAFPEQIAEGLTPWQPKRVLQNVRFGGAREGAVVVRIEAGGNDPVSGEPFVTLAGRTSAMHKTQGVGGRPGTGGPRQETFATLDGEPATTDILDGIDATWARYPGGAEIGKLTDEAIAQFKVEDLSKSGPALIEARTKLVPQLLAIRTKLAALPTDPVIADKRAQLDRILQAALGLSVRLRVSQPEFVPGEAVSFNPSASAALPVQWIAQQFGDKIGGKNFGKGLPLGPGQMNHLEILDTIPADAPPTQPYWLREETGDGMFRVADAKLIGRPESPPAFPAEFVFEVQGQTLRVPIEPVFVPLDAPDTPPRPLVIIPPVSFEFTSEVFLLAPGETRPVAVDVTAARADTAGKVQLEVPTGWKVTPAAQEFRIAQAGARARFTFQVTAPRQAASGWVAASAEVKGRRHSNRRIEISYPHLPFQLLQPPARARVVSAEVAVRGHRVGYLPGAGDSLAENLRQLGYDVTVLTGADLTAEKLRGLDAVVIGVRAFNERTDLAANFPALLAWVESGGTVVAQYNRPDRPLRTSQLGPYALSIAGQPPAMRVTDRNAPVQFLAADHPALNFPNKITSADFTGWVQERGAYFPGSWDAGHYVSLFAINDPGETQPASSVLVAKHGKGYYVYTGLAFFRQLPAGVPGAYRLFANLVSLGKE